MVSVAIMGHGVVGSGVDEIIRTHKERLFSAIGEELDVKYILDLRDFPESPHADRFTKNFEDIIGDVEVRVVVEAMGGLNPAYDYTKRLLKAGKSVVTSNKELVAQHGAELLQLAKANNSNYLFEASVGGGIPIIRPLSKCLAANEVDEIAGILNGTTNFILTKMISEGMGFDDALKLAQELGYAEKDPTADVEGFDACRKICILASLAYGKHVYPDNVHTEGITKITLEDVKYAENWGGVIKLIGRCKIVDGGKMDIGVAPMLVPRTSQLANINDVFNGIMVRGDCTGDVVFYGKGAGKLPTASAVVADVIDCALHLKRRKMIFWADCKENNILPAEESKSALYMRVKTADKEVAYNKITEALGEASVLTRDGEPENEAAFATKGEVKYGEALNKLKLIKEVELLSVIRIGNL